MKSKRNQGFTLVELLVVIAVIGILAALLLPVLSRAKERALRAKCLSNLKQVDLWFLSYAQDNHDRFPQFDNAQLPLCSIPTTLVDALISDHFDPRVLYDPALHFENPTRGGDFPLIEGKGPDYYAQYWYNLPANYPFRWIGYCLALSGATTLLPTNQNLFLIPQPIMEGGMILPAPDTSRRVLAAGIVVSDVGQNNAALRNNYSYTLSGHNSIAPPYRTAHLNSGQNYPSGDNVAMLDGSAAWRKFQDMIPRNAPSSANEATWIFWW